MSTTPHPKRTTRSSHHKAHKPLSLEEASHPAPLRPSSCALTVRHSEVYPFGEIQARSRRPTPLQRTMVQVSDPSENGKSWAIQIKGQGIYHLSHLRQDQIKRKYQILPKNGTRKPLQVNDRGLDLDVGCTNPGTRDSRSTPSILTEAQIADPAHENGNPCRSTPKSQNLSSKLVDRRDRSRDCRHQYSNCHFDVQYSYQMLLPGHHSPLNPLAWTMDLPVDVISYCRARSALTSSSLIAGPAVPHRKRSCISAHPSMVSDLPSRPSSVLSL